MRLSSNRGGGMNGFIEYWVSNRLDRTLTVFKPTDVQLVLAGGETYTTDLLPGLARAKKLLLIADLWDRESG